MPKMYVMCGISGSGKTSLSTKIAKDNNIKRLGIDDFYAKINGDECKHENTFNVWIAFFQEIQNTFINGEDCIIDTNALVWHQRMQFIEWFPNFEHHLIFIDAPLELQKKNNQSRRRKVPDDVMNKMAEKLQKPTAELDKNWDSITYIENKENVFQQPKTIKGNLPYFFNKEIKL